MRSLKTFYRTFWKVPPFFVPHMQCCSTAYEVVPHVVLLFSGITLCIRIFVIKFKIKSVAYSSQGSDTGQLDFCNWLADGSTTG